MDVIWVCGKCKCRDFRVIETNGSVIHIECSECGEKPKLLRVVELIGEEINEQART